jgi:hypothetical protein
MRERGTKRAPMIKWKNGLNPFTFRIQPW